MNFPHRNPTLLEAHAPKYLVFFKWRAQIFRLTFSRHIARLKTSARPPKLYGIIWAQMLQTASNSGGNKSSQGGRSNTDQRKTPQLHEMSKN